MRTPHTRRNPKFRLHGKSTAFPNIDLRELEKAKADNFRQRLEFIDFYVKRLKKTENKKWSSEQKALIG